MVLQIRVYRFTALLGSTKLPVFSTIGKLENKNKKPDLKSKKEAHNSGFIREIITQLAGNSTVSKKVSQATGKLCLLAKL